MSELDKVKNQVTGILKNLCARCKERIDHNCPVRQIIRQIETIRGIPVIVNDKLYHVVFN